MRGCERINRLAGLPFEVIRSSVGLGREIGGLAVQHMLSKAPFMQRPRDRDELRLVTEQAPNNVRAVATTFKKGRVKKSELLDRTNRQPATVINFPHPRTAGAVNTADALGVSPGQDLSQRSETEPLRRETVEADGRGEE